MISIIIPSRNEKYLQPTIEDLIKNAEGEIEIIVILDGYWPIPQLPDYPNVILIHRGEAQGLRAGINSAVAIAKGKYIMKTDAHCMFDQGFDVKLTAHVEPNWIVIPRRKRLDPETWTVKELNKVDVDYEFLSYPGDPNDWGGPGLHGKQWNERSRERLNKPEYMIDDDMSFQASCWLMHRKYFYDLDLMDEENYGIFYNEGQEEGLKCWLSGGRVVVNKNTWYAHWHKGKVEGGRGYHISKSALVTGNDFTNKWLTNSTGWPKQTLPFSWLIEHFWPVPTWTEENFKKIKDNEQWPK